MERELSNVASFIPGVLVGKSLTFSLKHILLNVGDKKSHFTYYMIACIDIIVLSFVLGISQRLPENQIRFFQLGILVTHRYYLVDLLDNDIHTVYRDYTD